MSRILKVNQGDYKLQVQSGGKIVLDVGNTGTVTIAGSTQSTSKTTGSLVVAGGIGVGGNITMDKILSMTPSSAAPSVPALGMIAVADNINWDPVSKIGILPYVTFYNGSAWQEFGAGGGSGGSVSRSTKSQNTTSIVNGASEYINIPGYKSYMLMTIEISGAAWVRLYTDSASRTADSSRSITTDPSPGSGVLAEFVSSGPQTIIVSPAVMGFNAESSPIAEIPATVTNLSGVTRSFMVTLTLLELEA